MYEPPKTASHDSGTPAELLAFMTQSWAVPTGPIPTLAGRERFAERRRKIAQLFPGDVLVIPTGHEKVRANDTNYRFRPGTDFMHEMQEATTSAQRTIAVLSPAYFGSDFSEAEWRSARYEHPEVGATCDELGDAGRRRQELLEVVEHHQNLASGEERSELFDRL